MAREELSASRRPRMTCKHRAMAEADDSRFGIELEAEHGEH